MLWPRHNYLKEGQAKGIPPDELRAALREAHAVQRAGLPAILSLAHLGQLTGISTDFLRRVVDRPSKTQAYRSFNVKKRSASRSDATVDQSAGPFSSDLLAERVCIHPRSPLPSSFLRRSPLRLEMAG